MPSNMPDIGLVIGEIRFEHLSILRKYVTWIKGNESLVENFNFYFLTPLSQNFKMLHFDAIPITIGCLVTEL